jgi:hypothetical protein
MLKNTLQKKLENVLSKDNLTMKLNIMPKLFITNIFFYLNKRSDRKNDDPQSNFVILNIMFHK